jgi:phosphoglycerate dehydrogenase-like enzyme
MAKLPSVLLTHRIFFDGASELREALTDALPAVEIRVGDDQSETLAALEDIEVVVTQRFDAEWINAAPRLRWIQALSAGVNWYDLDAFEEAGIALTSVSGVHAVPAGEQVLGYLTYFEREFDRALAQKRQRHWERFFPGTLQGSTVCIVGLGAIGGRVAELCAALEMDVIGTKRDPTTAPETVDEAYPPAELDAMLERAEYMVLCCPLTEETRDLLDADALGALPDDAVVINVARGEVIDEDALVEALDADEIRGAALDVVRKEPLSENSPLWEREDVLVTPHVAGWRPDYWERCADIFAENYRRYVVGAEDRLRNREV